MNHYPLSTINDPRQTQTHNQHFDFAAAEPGEAQCKQKITKQKRRLGVLPCFDPKRLLSLFLTPDY